jgi:hypothetical protein
MHSSVPCGHREEGRSTKEPLSLEGNTGKKTETADGLLGHVRGLLKQVSLSMVGAKSPFSGRRQPSGLRFPPSFSTPKSPYFR